MYVGHLFIANVAHKQYQEEQVFTSFSHPIIFYITMLHSCGFWLWQSWSWLAIMQIKYRKAVCGDLLKIINSAKSSYYSQSVNQSAYS